MLVNINPRKQHIRQQLVMFVDFADIKIMRSVLAQSAVYLKG